MIKVIGKKNCSACLATTNILKRNNIKFNYLMLDELNEDEKTNVLAMAAEIKKTSMPIIIKDNKIVELKEVI